MKFVAIAMSVMLAVGIQARSLQADAPSQLEQIRSAVVVYLGQVKDIALKAMDSLDEGVYTDVKLPESLDRIHGLVQTMSETLKPNNEAVALQLVESTGKLREQIIADVQELHKQLEPKRKELREVLLKAMEVDREKLTPIVKDWLANHQAEMDTLWLKLQPVISEISKAVANNVEETKSKLVPMMDAVRAKLTERLEELRGLVAPYAMEYKDQLTTFIGGMKDKSPELQAKLEALGNDLKAKLLEMWNIAKEAKP